MTDEIAEQRILRSYRRARTYPKTIRKLANLDLPYPVTLPQLAVWFGTFIALWYARPLWSPIAGSLQIFVLVVVPTGAAIVLRHLRLEGRSPVAMASGLLALLAAPHTGTIHGCAAHAPRSSTYGACLVMVLRPDPSPADETGSQEPEQLTLPLDLDKVAQR